MPTDNRKTVLDEHERRIYTELWNSLFDFRIATHNLVDWLQDRVHDDPHGKFIDTLNAYQPVVRRNEPFIAPTLFTPARAIVSSGRQIAASYRELQELQQQRDKCRGLATDEQIAEKMIKVDDRQQEAVAEIDRLFDEVKSTMQSRAMP